MKEDILYIQNDDSRPKPNNIVTKQYSVMETPQILPEEESSHKPGQTPAMTEKEQLELVYKEERKELLLKLKERMKVKHDAIKYSKLSLQEGGADCFKASQNFLEDNSEKSKKQSLLLEGEIGDMKERIEKMRNFIENNKDKDVTEVILISDSILI